MNFETNQALQKFEQLVRMGIVAKTHGDKVKVQTGDILTDWLPTPAALGHNFVAWHPLRVGIQVLMVCPSGDISQAVIVQALYNNETPAPSQNKQDDVILFNDGTTIKKTATTLEIKATCNVVIKSRSNIIIKGSTTIDGNLTINGTSTATDHVSGTTSGKYHTHIDAEGRATGVAL